MIYLESFHMPSRQEEERYLDPQANPIHRRTCYTTKYPFRVFPMRGLPETWQFAPVTIFYGQRHLERLLSEAEQAADARWTEWMEQEVKNERKQH